MQKLTVRFGKEETGSEAATKAGFIDVFKSLLCGSHWQHVLFVRKLCIKEQLTEATVVDKRCPRAGPQVDEERWNCPQLCPQQQSPEQAPHPAQVGTVSPLGPESTRSL